MVNTLAGSYNTSEMVVMRNLRLPGLDKNRNVDQQKALVFESKTYKYDITLGADFLTKLELMSNTARAPYNGLKMNCHSGTHSSSKIKTMQLWQKSVQSNSLAWTGMTQHAMQQKYWMRNTKSSYR